MIELQDVSMKQGSFEFNAISLLVEAGQYAILMGKTGSGKTTILELICGLRTVDNGRISLNERDVTHIPPPERQIGYLPQDLALFPTMTVREQLEFPLAVRKVPSVEIEHRVTSLGETLGIAHLFARKPKGLSGGESQRVALGRALSFSPRILLLDEPFSALDQLTRTEMYQLVRRIVRETAVTTLHVTHNESDAAALADVRFTLTNGEIVREGAESGNESVQPTSEPNKSSMQQ